MGMVNLADHIYPTVWLLADYYSSVLEHLNSRYQIYHYIGISSQFANSSIQKIGAKSLGELQFGIKSLI